VPDPQKDDRVRPSDWVVLVGEEHPEKLFFDKDSISKLKKGESSSLIITKPDELQGKALGFYKSSYINVEEWVAMALAVTSTSDSQGAVFSPTSWKYDDTWISTTFQESNEDKKMYEYVIDVDDWKLEDMTPLWILRGKDSSRTRLDPNKGETNGRAFVLNDECSISPRDERGLFLGRMGADHGDAEKIRNLIRLNASVDTVKESLVDKDKDFINEIEHDIKMTFLCLACRCGRYDIAKFLVERGADVEPDVEFRPLDLACYHGRKEIVDLLLDHGADINVLNGFATSPLGAATLSGHVKIAEKLLDRDDCNIHGGKNPSLSHSIINNHVECVEFLLEKGSSLDVYYENENEEYENKGYPLQQACKKNSVDSLPIVKVIMKKRGDLDIKRIKKISGRDGTMAMGNLITAYASLEPMELSLCIARAFAKYKVAPDEIDNNNPFKACIDLAQEARQRWSKVRKSDPSTADKMLTLYTNLQLGAVAVLERLHKNTMEEGYGKVQRISSTA